YRRRRRFAPRPSAFRALRAPSDDRDRIPDARVDGHMGDRTTIDSRDLGARGGIALRPEGSSRSDPDRAHDRSDSARAVVMHILITDSGVGGLSVCAFAEKFVRTHGLKEPVRLTFANAAPENDY